MRPGELIDRVGDIQNARYFAPAGTPIEARSLLPGTNINNLKTYEVVKPFPVKMGVAAPAHGYPGGGTQYITPIKGQYLIDHNIIKPNPPMPLK